MADVKTFRWDYREQPPLDDIAAAVAEMSDGLVVITIPETGTDEYRLTVTRASGGSLPCSVCEGTGSPHGVPQPLDDLHITGRVARERDEARALISEMLQAIGESCWLPPRLAQWRERAGVTEDGNG